jgi:hypothetical protein
MKPIDQELINAIPDAVGKTRAGCQEAADTALAVLFMIGEQFKQFLTFPLIMSNDVEVWPMPPPFTLPMTNNIDAIEANLNEFLRHTKINANAFNEEVNINNVPGARSIAEKTPHDSGMIWHLANDLGRLLAGQEGETVFRTLDLSENTEYLYACAIALGEPPAPPQPELEAEAEAEPVGQKSKKKSTGNKVEDL